MREVERRSRLLKSPVLKISFMLDYVFETSISWKLLIASECRELDQKCCDCTLRSAESALAPLAASDMSKMFYTAGLSASVLELCAGSGSICPPPGRKSAYVPYAVLGWDLPWLRTDTHVGGPEFCDAFRMPSASRRCLGR